MQEKFMSDEFILTVEYSAVDQDRALLQSTRKTKPKRANGRKKKKKHRLKFSYMRSRRHKIK